MSKVFISGKITGDPDYQKKFAKAEEHLKNKGHLVMNPAILPEGFTWEEYMTITLAMLDCCDTIVMLNGWEESRGAIMEKKMAESKGKHVRFQKSPK